MTREEAIIRIEDYAAYLHGKPEPTYQIEVALDVAIAALREQEERSKGCDWCRSLENGDYRLGDLIARGYVEHTFCGDGRPYTQKAKFCPMCGRRLEEV